MSFVANSENRGVNHNADISSTKPAWGGTPLKSKSQQSGLPVTPFKQPSPNEDQSSNHNNKNNIISHQTTTNHAQNAAVVLTPKPASKSHAVAPNALESNINDAQFEKKQYEQSFSTEHEESEEIGLEEEEQYFAETGEMTIEEEEIEVEPIDIARPEDENWEEWSHESLAAYAVQMNLAIIQQHEDIHQWRKVCNRLNKEGQAVNDQYVQQCHRLQRTSSMLKEARKENEELRREVQSAKSSNLDSEQQFQAQNARFKSNMEACQTLRDSLSNAHKKLREMEASKAQSQSEVRSLEALLSESDAALNSSLQVAQNLSANVDQLKATNAHLAEENTSLKAELIALQSESAQRIQVLASKVDSLEKENSVFSQKINSLASTPDTKVEEDVVPISSSSSVLQTPSKKLVVSSNVTSSQKKFEAVSILLETMRARNSKLEEEVAQQERSKKLQLEEANQNEMMWKQTARQIQTELAASEDKIQALESVNCALQSQLESASKKLASATKETSIIPQLQSRINELERQANQQADLLQDALEKAQSAESLQNCIANLESSLHSLQNDITTVTSQKQQLEDDLRLMYIQHKQEKADLEAIYKHEDYKSRYADTALKCASLHQKLSHVLDFVANNADLSKLTSSVEDLSHMQSTEGWKSDGFIIEQAESNQHSTPRNTQSRWSSNLNSNSPLQSTPSKDTSVDRQNSKVTNHRGGRTVGTPKFSKQSQSQQQNRHPSMNRRGSSIAPAGEILSQSQSAAGSNLAMVISVVQLCNEWKSRCQELATKIIMLEQSFSLTKAIHQKRLREAETRLKEQHQGEVEAIYIGHDSQLSRLYRDIEEQKAIIDAQTETMGEMKRQFTIDREEYKSELDSLKSHLQEREATIAFLENEAIVNTQTEQESRKQLEDGFKEKISQLETESGRFQMDIQELKEMYDKSQFSLIESQDQLMYTRKRLARFEDALKERNTMAETFAVVLQQSVEQRDQLESQLGQYVDYTNQLSNQLELTEVMVSRAKGVIITNQFKLQAVEHTLQLTQASMERNASEYSQALGVKEERIQELEVELNGMANRATNLSQEVLQLNNSLVSKSQEIEDLIQQQLQLNGELTLANSNLVSATVNLQEQSQLLQELEARQHAAADQLASQQSSIEQYKNRLESMESELTESISAKQALEAVRLVMESDLENVRTALVHSKLQSAQLDAKIVQLQLEYDELSQSAYSTTQTMKGEVARLELLMERQRTEYDLLKQEQQALEQANIQMQQSTQSIQESNVELQRNNNDLEEQIGIARDEKDKLLAKIAGLQESLAQQALANTQQVNLSASQSLINPEIEDLYNQHHMWLEEMRTRIFEVAQKHTEDVSNRNELRQDIANQRASIESMECKICDLEEQIDNYKNIEKNFIQDLALAKDSHRQLILQIGALFSLINLVNLASSSHGVPNSYSIEAAAKESNVVATLQEVMLLQRKSQSLTHKLQYLEDENAQLKTELAKCKSTLYEKEDLFQALSKRWMDRCSKIDERLRFAELTKEHLLIFLGDVKESLLHTAQVPAVRELLVRWIPKMNKLALAASHPLENKDTQ